MDTSVWNFYFATDTPDKRETTQIFFENLPAANVDIYIAEPVLTEIRNSQERTQKLLLELIGRFEPSRLEDIDEILGLAGEYLTHGALPTGSKIDALHIAFASVYEIDCLIS